MNVLENLKIDKVSILNLKDGDVLFIKTHHSTSYSEMVELRNSLKEFFKEKNIEFWISNRVEDLKVIRR